MTVARCAASAPARSDERRILRDGRRPPRGEPRRRGARSPARDRGRAERYGRAGHEARSPTRRHVSSIVHAIGARRGGDGSHQPVGVFVAERGARPSSCSCSNSRFAAATRSPVQLDPRVEQEVVRPRRASTSSPSNSMRRAASAHRSACTSRRPPRPSFRSGSSRKATSPACACALARPAAGGVRASASAPLLPLGERAFGQLVRERRVAGEMASAQQRRRSVEIVSRQGERLPHRAHAVAEREPLVPDGIPEAIGDRADVGAFVVEEHDVDVAAADTAPPARTRRRPRARHRARRRSRRRSRRSSASQRRRARCGRDTTLDRRATVSANDSARSSLTRSSYRWLRRRARRCGCERCCRPA